MNQTSHTQPIFKPTHRQDQNLMIYLVYKLRFIIILNDEQQITLLQQVALQTLP